MRQDIQALRGFAVLLVLFYHAGVAAFSGGFLGVDIFFVISGFLITRHVAEAVDAGDFLFAAFYFRRARRLLPAAYVTFAVTAIAGWFLLRPDAFEELQAQLFGALTFTANIVLWRQTGYFDGASETKPLLHIWSLSIEEQYYFILPLAVALLPKRVRLPAFVAAALASLALCLFAVGPKPSASFYLLPTRAWELLVGSLGALAYERLVAARATRLSFWPALVALVIIPVTPTGAPHPGLDALIVCCATMVIIARQSNWLSENRLVVPLARIGDFSYSLYLVHWPMLVFLNVTWVGDAPFSARLEALALSFVAGYALYHFVEKPIWRSPMRVSPRNASAFLACGALIFTGASSARHTDSLAEAIDARLRPNYGLSMSCEFSENFTPKADCMTSQQPNSVALGRFHRDASRRRPRRDIACRTRSGDEKHVRTFARPCARRKESVRAE